MHPDLDATSFVYNICAREKMCMAWASLDNITDPASTHCHCQDNDVPRDAGGMPHGWDCHTGADDEIEPSASRTAIYVFRQCHAKRSLRHVRRCARHDNRLDELRLCRHEVPTSRVIGELPVRPNCDGSVHTGRRHGRVCCKDESAVTPRWLLANG